MSGVDRELLFKARLPEEDYELPGFGTLRIRGLSRGEVLAAQRDDPDSALFERRLLAKGVVDPKLTVTDVGRWQEASPAGELEPLIEAVQRLSGLGKTSDRAAYDSFRGQPGPGIRDDAGSETVDDGGAAASRNEQ